MENKTENQASKERPWQTREPSCIEEGEVWLIKLQNQVAEINSQLGVKWYRHLSPERQAKFANEQAFYHWRREAIRAKMHTEKAVRTIKEWLKKESLTIHAIMQGDQEFPAGTPVEILLLVAALRCLKEYHSACPHLRHEDWNLEDSIRNHIQGYLRSRRA